MINYYLLTKPGILFGNLVTFAAGFFLASKGGMHPWLFLATLLGLGLIMASACVFNNYIDQKIDSAMSRTKNRALVLGVIPENNALIFAALLVVFGVAILLTYTNLLATAVAAIGFIIYVFFYSFWKARTVYGTAIGSLAGAVPPVVGYCAVSNSFDGGAALLFILLVLWQMPHFFAIAILHMDDYKAAKIPVLPIEKGLLVTKVHMLLYIIGFLATLSLLTAWNYTGYWYLGICMALGIGWLGLCIQGFAQKNTLAWARQMFLCSLLVISAICLMIPLDAVKP